MDKFPFKRNKGIKPECLLKIKSKLDLEDSIDITNEIYRYIQKYKVGIRLDAKPGSIDLAIALLAIRATAGMIRSYPQIKEIISDIKNFAKRRNFKLKEMVDETGEKNFIFERDENKENNVTIQEEYYYQEENEEEDNESNMLTN